jgi:hypothetical protein
MEKMTGWEMQMRRERSVERREYDERIAWIRAHESVVSDTYFAKHDPGIRIVPTDDRSAAPIETDPFYNSGTLLCERCTHRLSPFVYELQSRHT